MKKQPTLKDFIGTHVKYDSYGGYIWGVQPDNSVQMIGEVRGYGAIQHLFKDTVSADKFQDELGQFIVDAINEKLARNA